MIEKFQFFITNLFGEIFNELIVVFCEGEFLFLQSLNAFLSVLDHSFEG